MKATLVGLKKITGKDGRKWAQLGMMYKDINAIGGAFASAVMVSDQNGISDRLVPGQKYDVDFDNRGSLLGIEAIKE